jgi:hypothetical protein
MTGGLNSIPMDMDRTFLYDHFVATPATAQLLKKIGLVKGHVMRYIPHHLWRIVDR